MPLQVATSSQVSLVMSGLLVELGPVSLNVGFVDRLYPVLRVSVRGSTRLTGLVVESADLPGALADQIKN